MRKSLIIFAIAVGFLMTTIAAKPQMTTSNSTEFVQEKATVSPLCMAIVKGDFEAVKKFVEMGTNVNEKSNGMTPAMFAARYNKVEILKFLVDQGADLKKRSVTGMNVKKYAELSNAKAVIDYLNDLDS